MATPTIQRRRLGMALRRAREAAARTQEDAAERIESATSKLSRIEQGQSGIRLTDLTALLDLYEVPEDDREWMKTMARAGRQRGRWSSYRRVIPNWFRDYLDLEADASEIHWYRTEVLPGILQIEPYIRASYIRNASATEDEVDRQVDIRLQRQAILVQPGRTLQFILSESALRRSIGGASVMREQLHHLAEVAGRPNIQMQVLPFDAQTYQPASYAFIILRFEHDAASDVVYVEDLTDAAYLDRPDWVQAYTSLWNRLQAAALGPAESRELILRIAGEES